MKKQRVMLQKDKKKIIRTILQSLVILIVLVIILKLFFYTKKYEPYEDESKTQRDNGFIAVSYFGISRIENGLQVSEKQLQSQLSALKKCGYVTITQKDVIDYFLNDGKLPEKALFLMFEDGRRDTSIFAQKILEKINYKATMLTYAGRINGLDNQFLSYENILNMNDSNFWEFGSNGLRLAYINVTDTFDNYIGEIDIPEFLKIVPYLNQKDYNHYLMDFIRDKEGIPKETYDEMEDRINTDYSLLEDIYVKYTNEMPKLYALMHSNTGQFGTNELVSDINKKNIQKLFDINFNREGTCKNIKSNNIYDLTRVQPQKYWSTNHLLMQISNDTNEDIDFIIGNKKIANKWVSMEGAAEFTSNKIILTTECLGRSGLKLNNSKSFNINIKTTLLGNKYGEQSLYLRAKDKFNAYVKVSFIENYIKIIEKSNSKEKILNAINLEEALGIKRISIDEAIVHADIIRNEIQNNKQEITRLKKIDPKTIEDGAKAYNNNIRLNETGEWHVDITLNEDELNISVNGIKVVSGQKVSLLDEGDFYIAASLDDASYIERNLAEKIYDGVFKNLSITDLDNDKLLFSNKIKGIDLIKHKSIEVIKSLVNWFIEIL